MSIRFRAVGIDHTPKDGYPQVREEEPWTFDLDEAKRARDAMQEADPPFDRVIVELQDVTYSTIQALDERDKIPDSEILGLAGEADDA